MCDCVCVCVKEVGVMWEGLGARVGGGGGGEKGEGCNNL